MSLRCFVFKLTYFNNKSKRRFQPSGEFGIVHIVTVSVCWKLSCSSSSGNTSQISSVYRTHLGKIPLAWTTYPENFMFPLSVFRCHCFSCTSWAAGVLRVREYGFSSFAAGDSQTAVHPIIFKISRSLHKSWDGWQRGSTKNDPGSTRWHWTVFCARGCSATLPKKTKIFKNFGKRGRAPSGRGHSTGQWWYPTSSGAPSLSPLQE